MTLLTICIPTLPEQISVMHLHRLREILDPQLNDEVEVLIDPRPRSVPTGTKRNDMYNQAHGKYVCSVDCDDEVSGIYVSEILKAIRGFEPDCVTFNGYMTTNGAARVEWSIKLGEKYEARKDPDSITRYYRWPNHLVPVKKELAIQAKFPDIWQGEDYQWSVQMKERNLLKTSHHINLQLYHYKFITNK